MNWDPMVALIVAAAGAVFLGAVYWWGRPGSRPQGLKRSAESGERREPTLGAGDGEATPSQAAEAAASGHGSSSAASKPKPAGGERNDPQIDKIVTLHVELADGELIRGADLVVAAEKAGLTYGAMGIFHRLVDGRAQQGPIFSVANMVKPGHFDLADLDALEVPGLTFFMTLPGPMPALDAWEAMLPAAQRMAELLGGQVLDERRGTMGRQRVALIRDELRAFDRKREMQGLR